MVKHTLDTIGTKLRLFNDFTRGELRRRHITQDKLADYLSISRSTLTNRLNGVIEWSLRDALKVAEFFDVDLDEVIGG